MGLPAIASTAIDDYVLADVDRPLIPYLLGGLDSLRYTTFEGEDADIAATQDAIQTQIYRMTLAAQEDPDPLRLHWDFRVSTGRFVFTTAPNGWISGSYTSGQGYRDALDPTYRFGRWVYIFRNLSNFRARRIVIDFARELGTFDPSLNPTTTATIKITFGATVIITESLNQASSATNGRYDINLGNAYSINGLGIEAQVSGGIAGAVQDSGSFTLKRLSIWE